MHAGQCSRENRWQVRGRNAKYVVNVRLLVWLQWVEQSGPQTNSLQFYMWHHGTRTMWIKPCIFREVYHYPRMNQLESSGRELTSCWICLQRPSLSNRSLLSIRHPPPVEMEPLQVPSLKEGTDLPSPKPDVEEWTRWKIQACPQEADE